MTQFKAEWIQKPLTKEIIEHTNSISKKLAECDEIKRKGALTTSQLRKFFGQLKRIQADFENQKEEIPMLLPKLAYAVGRDKNDRGINKTKIDEFYLEVEVGLKALDYNKRSEFDRFVAIIESIVAYHKFHGGK